MTQNTRELVKTCVKVCEVARFRVAPSICPGDGVVSVLGMWECLTLGGGATTVVVGHLVGVAIERKVSE